MDLCEPSGWVCIAVKDMREKPIRTFMLQIAVRNNFDRIFLKAFDTFFLPFRLSVIIKMDVIVTVRSR